MKTYEIKDLIFADSLKGIRLVAGETKSDNKIRNVNIIDNPDSYDWLKSGDFILTTGYIFKDNPKQLITVLDNLAKINCAGLGFKVRRYFESIPDELISHANKLNVPVIEIPIKYSLSDVSNEINDELHKQEESLLKDYMSIHNKFNECSLVGKGMHGILSTLSEFVKNPTVFFDGEYRFVEKCDPHNLLAHLKLKKFDKILPEEFLNQFPSEIIGKSKIISRRFPDENGSLVARIAVLEDEDESYGYIMVFEHQQQIDDIGFLALECSLAPAIIERVKLKQINEVKHQLRQDFFDDLLSGKIESVNAVTSLAELHRMNAKGTYMCQVIKLSNAEKAFGSNEEQLNKFLAFKKKIIEKIERISATQGYNTVSIHRANLIITFIKVNDLSSYKNAKSFLKDFPNVVSNYILTNEDVEFSVGIGSPIADYLNIRKSYFQAISAIEYAGEQKSNSISFYEDCMLDHLLNCIEDSNAISEFIDVSLGKLIAYDKNHSANMVATLEAYFESNANVSNAAKKLFLHRNSLIYRIEKIKEILDSDLKNASDLLMLQIGLRLYKLNQ